jgi:hypothetical protein
MAPVDQPSHSAGNDGFTALANREAETGVRRSP